MKAQTKVKRGRPVKIEWNKVVRMWKTHTNREIADFLGCTYQAVKVKREQLVNAARLKGQSGAFYQQTAKAYTHKRPAA